jgi:two-component system nitrate/nitrite response regulator NarL
MAASLRTRKPVVGEVHRVAIVAEVRVYREGLAQVLRGIPRVSVVATACGADAVSTVRAHHPEVVLLDMAVPDRLHVARALGAMTNAPAVIALALDADGDEVLECVEAGVRGYVVRDASVEDVVAAVESVGRGEVLCSPRIVATMVRRLAALAAPATSQHSVLTAREQEILILIGQNRSNKEIARALGIELGTVKSHVHNIYEKLKVHRRGEAAERARGVAAPPDAFPHEAFRQLS